VSKKSGNSCLKFLILDKDVKTFLVLSNPIDTLTNSIWKLVTFLVKIGSGFIITEDRNARALSKLFDFINNFECFKFHCNSGISIC
jgi:hypothetical protein